MRNRYLSLFFIVLLMGCQKRPSAEEIVAQSIQAHGFSKQPDSLSYAKLTRLYFPDGRLEKTIEQQHQISWRPFTYSIYETNAGQENITQYQNGSYGRLINGDQMTSPAAVTQAEIAIKTAYYVFWQPAKLNDTKAVMRFIGQREIQQGVFANAVEVAYPESSSTDQWVFYFDPKTKLNLGYSVQHNGRWSLILNDAFHLEHQPVLIKERRSFFIDSVAKTQVLRAAYTYTLEE